MVTVYCDNEKCENHTGEMDRVGDDSRQEWYEDYYECYICGSKKIHRREFNQKGYITDDRIIELKEDEKNMEGKNANKT